MELALEDLQECIRLLQAQQQNDQMKKTALHAKHRIGKRLQLWQDATERHPSTTTAAAATSNTRIANHTETTPLSHNTTTVNGTTTTTAKTTPVIATTMNGHSALPPSAAANVAVTEEPPAPPRPPPDQQRQDVMKLLIARSVGLQRSHTNTSTTNPAGQGEALFLLDWNWWCQWCWHVDFFHTAGAADNNTSGKNAKADRILQCLPAGAIRPYKNKHNANPRKRKEDDEESSTDSTDSDEDESDPGPPGPLDNSALLLLPVGVDSSDPRNGTTTPSGGSAQDSTKSRFYQQWYRHFQPAEEDDAINNNNHHTNNLNFSNGGTAAVKGRTNVCLRPNLVRGFHYELIPREVYCALKSWYREKTPSICRRTVLMTTSSSNSSNNQEERVVTSIQLYPLHPPPTAAAARNRRRSSRASLAVAEQGDAGDESGAWPRPGAVSLMPRGVPDRCSL